SLSMFERKSAVRLTRRGVCTMARWRNGCRSLRSSAITTARSRCRNGSRKTKVSSDLRDKKIAPVHCTGAEWEVPENSKLLTTDSVSHGRADVATSQSQISNFDPLISRLAGPLEPGDRAAFRAAAENALIGCSGEGQAYRTLRDLWRG